MNALLAYSFAHQPTLQVDFLVVVLAPPLRLLATGAAAPLARKLRVNYGLGISGAWITVIVGLAITEIPIVSIEELDQSS